MVQLGMFIRRWSHGKVRVNGRPISKRLLQKHETLPFKRVNVAALIMKDDLCSQLRPKAKEIC